MSVKRRRKFRKLLTYYKTLVSYWHMKKVILIGLLVILLIGCVIYTFPQIAFGDGSANKGKPGSKFTLEYVRGKINAQINPVSYPPFTYDYRFSPVENVRNFNTSGNNYYGHIIFTPEETEEAIKECR